MDHDRGRYCRFLAWYFTSIYSLLSGSANGNKIEIEIHITRLD